MAITKFEHENNGNAWVIDDPSSLDELEEKAREILSEKQIEFFKNYPASLNQFIEQAKFIEFKNWLIKLKTALNIELEIYEEGYLSAEVWFSFKFKDDYEIRISCEPVLEELNIDNEKLKNVVETIGKINTAGYSYAGGLDPYDWHERLYSTECGEELGYDKKNGNHLLEF